MANLNNDVTLTGKVVEIKSRKGVDSKNSEYVAGQVLLETAPDNIISIDFYQNKLKKSDNKENSAYKGIMTMIDEFRTIAKDGREAADIVSLSQGTLAENFFYNNNDALVRTFRINGAFFNRKANAPLENKFVLSGIVARVNDEIIKDVPTGRLFVELLAIGYQNKGDLIKLIAEDPAGVQYLKNSCNEGVEVKFAGEIIVSEIHQEFREEVAFGDPIVRVETKTERKLLIKSASAPTTPTVDSETIQSILAERQGRIAQALDKHKAKAATTNTTAKTGAKFVI